MRHFPTFVALAAITVGVAIPASAQDDSLPRDWGGIEACAAIAGADERHRCLDGELARLGLLTQSATPAAAVRGMDDRDTVQTDAAVPAAVPAAVQAAGPGSAIRPAPVRAPQSPSVAAGAIASVRMIGRSNIEIVADDGSRWRSTSSRTFNRTPRVGAPFAVERGALGSYNCRIEVSTTFKCEPIS